MYICKGFPLNDVPHVGQFKDIQGILDVLILPEKIVIYICSMQNVT